MVLMNVDDIPVAKIIMILWVIICQFVKVDLFSCISIYLWTCIPPSSISHTGHVPIQQKNQVLFRHLTRCFGQQVLLTLSEALRFVVLGTLLVHFCRQVLNGCMVKINMKLFIFHRDGRPNEI